MSTPIKEENRKRIITKTTNLKVIYVLPACYDTFNSCSKRAMTETINLTLEVPLPVEPCNASYAISKFMHHTVEFAR
jgi:hypothetical protein